MPRKYIPPPTPTPKPPGQLTAEAVASLQRVIERSEHCMCTWIKPGIDGGLPFHDALATVTNQRDMAQAILRSYGHPVTDTGTG